MHYHSKKKKIRGWKRHKRKIDRWKRHAMTFPFDELHAHKRTYVKLTIHPFYISFEGKLPAWFVREVFDAVLDVYHSWHEQLQLLHEPYDLMVWLFDPDFMKSQVVVSYRDCLHFYDQTFEQREQQRAFPTDKFVNDPMKVNDMNWQLCIHTTDWTKEIFDGWLEDDLITRQELDRYKRNVYETMVLSNGDLLYLIDSGNVWIGKHTQEG
ncbi:hypothetical protein [Geomicrobium sediminis]|uniref:DUF3841 domain-containing protein n=1 Tax=Geomicrobium sediminis TaxID=1347788 RepID=A0ABS2P8J0_9BACL|nr:hypothetical protein [Geomicrobium sediminis]MBM7631729.1 hypothetical protein [Geomicrobium sediminis]